MTRLLAAALLAGTALAFSLSAHADDLVTNDRAGAADAPNKLVFALPSWQNQSFSAVQNPLWKSMHVPGIPAGHVNVNAHVRGARLEDRNIRALRAEIRTLQGLRQTLRCRRRTLRTERR